MDSKKIFEKYYSRLAREGMLKAFICGLIVGFAVDFVIALVTWFFEGFTWWFVLALAVGVLIGAAVAFILYNKVFKPTTKKIAQRIDALGLEERLITMTELESDDSYIALRQREDAKIKMNEIASKSIKFVIARSLIIMAAIVGVFGLSMTTVNALAAFGIIKSGKEIITPYDPYSDSLLVLYMTDSAYGEIIGEVEQVVERGGDTTPVYVEPIGEWIFAGWDDGNQEAERFETNVQEDMIITATFYFVGTGEGSGDSNQDSSDQEPDEEDDSNKPKEEQDSGEGPTLDSDDNAVPQPPNADAENNNTWKDGSIPYGDDFFDLYPDLLEALEDNNLTAEQRKGLESYIESLKAGVEEKGSGDDE